MVKIYDTGQQDYVNDVFLYNTIHSCLLSFDFQLRWYVYFVACVVWFVLYSISFSTL